MSIARALLEGSGESGGGLGLLECCGVFPLLLESRIESVCLKDGRSRWLIANKAMLETFGLDGVDYIGKTSSELARNSLYLSIIAQDMDMTDELAWTYREPLSYELPVPGSAGEGGWLVEGTKLPVFSRDGERCLLIEMGLGYTNCLSRRDQHARIRACSETVFSLMHVIDDLSTRLRSTSTFMDVCRETIPIFSATFGYDSLRLYAFDEAFSASFCSEKGDSPVPGLTFVDPAGYAHLPSDDRRLLKSVDSTLMISSAEDPPDHDTMLRLKEMHGGESLIAIPFRCQDETGGLLCLWTTNPVILSGKRMRILSLAVEFLACAFERIVNRQMKLETDGARDILNRSLEYASVGNVAVSIAHDINQPLTALRLNVDRMLYMRELNRDLPTEEVYGNMGFIVEQADRIDSYINMIGDFTECMENDIKQVFSLNSTVKHLLDSSRPCFEKHQVMINVRYDMRDPRVNANSSVLRRILFNMLVHYIKLIRECGAEKKTIDLTTFNEDEVCGITIGYTTADNDTGCTDTNGGREVDSAGDIPLELVIVDKLVRKMNGSVQVVSRPEQLRRYRIQMPCYTESEIKR